MEHRLKTVQPFFERVRMGEKTAELRLNDRNFQVGDFMTLVEFDPISGQTGHEIRCIITHVLSNYKGLEKGYCVISFKKLM